jgi:replication factor C subunit 2/4
LSLPPPNQVCDQPHPALLQSVVLKCSLGDVVGAHLVVKALWDQGYSCMDILGTLFKVTPRHASAPLKDTRSR